MVKIEDMELQVRKGRKDGQGGGFLSGKMRGASSTGRRCAQEGLGLG